MQYLVTTWQHLVTPWQHLVTPGNTWSPLTANIRTQTATSIVAPTMKFEFPAPFAPQTPHSRARGGCCRFKWGDPPNPPFSRHPRYAKTLYAHPRYAKILHSPFRMAIFDSSPCNGQTDRLRRGRAPDQCPSPHALGGCCFFEWGGPRKPPTPAPGVDVAPSNGGDPPNPPSPVPSPLRQNTSLPIPNGHFRYLK